jgi:hypothetical protein
MESHRHGRAHRRQVLRRGLLRAGMIAGALVGISLVVGILGYRHFAGLGWIDSFYNASMIMSGMGPTDVPLSSEAKIFAGVYAIYSGLVLIAATGVVLSPFMTHVLHAFHAEHDSQDGK